MKETFSKIIFMAKANTNGPMVEFIAASGSTTKWKVKELSLGVMAVAMLVVIKMTRNTATEPLSGPMDASTSESGVRANNMAKVFTSKKARNDKAFGKWARELSGSKLKHHQQLMAPNDQSINTKN